MLLAAALTAIASGALADEIEDAHRLALQGRDSYWNCLAREYSRDGTQGMSAKDFTADIQSICPSERQNFRVTLIDYLSMQYPNADTSAHLSTANRAIEMAQKDIITAFIKHKAANLPRMLRRLELTDMDAAARIHRRAYHKALPMLAGSHTSEEDRWFFRARLFCVRAVGAFDDEVIAFRKELIGLRPAGGARAGPWHQAARRRPAFIRPTAALDVSTLCAGAALL